MPSSNVTVNENAKIILSAQSDAAVTVESEESNGFIPIILRNIKSGFVQHVKLRVGDGGTADFTGFNSTADIALIVSAFRRLGAYTVPAGFTASLDAGQPVHLFLGDSG